MTEINTEYEKCRLLTSFFENSKEAINRNMQKIMTRKQYNMSQITTLQDYFSKLIENTTENGRTILKDLKDNAYSNPWFRKAAFIFSLNTRINVQKSFWRLKDSTEFGESESFLIHPNE